MKVLPVLKRLLPLVIGVVVAMAHDDETMSRLRRLASSGGDVRVWVQYKKSATHQQVLQAIQSQVMSITKDSEQDIQSLLRPDKGRPSVGNAKTPLRMHYDFFSYGLKSISMSVNEQMLDALENDPNVEDIAEDTKYYPMDAVANLRGGGGGSPRQTQEDLVDPTLYDDPLWDWCKEYDDDLFDFCNGGGGDDSTVEETIPYGITMVQAPQAWKKGYYGQGVKVCVIDSGLDKSHREYNTTKWKGISTTAGSWNTDGCGHGTHVAGTIAAKQNDFGVVGVAPKAEIISVKVFRDDCEWAYSADVFDAALKCQKKGAKVINMSLGGEDPTEASRVAFAKLRKQGVVVIAAAGNDGSTNFLYPASYPSVVSVAALDSSKNIAWFSQRNSQVDLAAPGVDVYSTEPVDQGRYGYKDGTSMATPHVSGVAALLFSKNPSASANTIINAMTASAMDLGDAGRDDVFGFGLVQANKALAKV